MLSQETSRFQLEQTPWARSSPDNSRNISVSAQEFTETCAGQFRSGGKLINSVHPSYSPRSCRAHLNEVGQKRLTSQTHKTASNIPKYNGLKSRMSSLRTTAHCQMYYH